jgi:undecaprenyl-diphosphatase
MSALEAVVLGIVQGLTEFLPISSTAHLRIVPALLGWSDPGAAYSAVIQLGTVGAVLVYFAKDMRVLGTAFFKGLLARQPFGTQDSRLAWYVVLGTLPAAILGLLLKKQIETSLRSLWVIAASMIVLAVVLFLVERIAQHQRSIEQMTLRDGLVIGLWQALALVPGSSRSGTTLTGGLSLGLTREAAARYSFLLSIPITTMAGVFQLRHLGDRGGASVADLAIGTLVSFVTGLLAIWALLKFLRTRSTLVFVAYRVVAGLTLVGLLSAGVLSAT